MRPLLVSLVLAGLSTTVAGEPFQFEDKFDSYPEGSAGEPRWEASQVGFGIAGGVLRADMGEDSGIAVLRAAPVGQVLSVEASLRVERTHPADWKTAGIGFWLDERNYWHLAMVEAPESMGKRHFVELSEMLDGVWNAHYEQPTRLTTTEDSGPFAWETGHTYQLRVTLTREQGTPKLTGEVFDGPDRRYRCVRRLDNRAVNRGWPMLDASRVDAGFDDVKVTVTETAKPPASPAEKILPPFASSPQTLGAPGKATGFFRVEQDGATWWLVDPNGCRTLSLGTDHVRYQGHHCEALGYSPYGRITAKKYGNPEAWAREATNRLRAWGFNVLGAGNSQEARHHHIAHTEFLSFGAGFAGIAALVEKTTWTGWPDVFDPRFERYCDLLARKKCVPARQDPWLLAYFLDNELEWWGKSHRPWGLAEDTCKLPATAAGKQALVASLRGFYHDEVRAFNADFQAKLSQFDDLLSAKELPQPTTDRARTALDAFIAEAAKRYFKITTAAVRRHDPNHLVIGCRFAHDAPDAAWQQAGATCDVVTVNVYPRIDLLQERTVGLEEHLRNHFDLCQKPLIITEWSFPALDAKDSTGRPLPSKHGAGMRVDTQEQKAACYAIMQRTLFSLPFVIGSHYFMWSDEPALGISSSFPEDSNYGLVSESDEPYAALTATAARVNPQMPALHAGQIRAADVPSGLAPAAASAPAPAPAAPGELRFDRTASGYAVETGPLRLMKDGPGGALFDHIALRDKASHAWIELGEYVPVMQVDVQGQKGWPHATRVISLEVREQTPGRLVLEATCEGKGTAEWKAGYRLTLEPGRASFRSQGLWVENAGKAPWHLGGYFHYLPSKIGGDAANDVVGGPDVPNYWQKMASWRDPALGLQFGVAPLQQDERIRCQFWIEGDSRHPDCWRTVDRKLNPGERWVAEQDEPTVVIFGLQETPGSPHPWRTLP